MTSLLLPNELKQMESFSCFSFKRVIEFKSSQVTFHRGTSLRMMKTIMMMMLMMMMMMPVIKTLFKEGNI